MVIQNFFGALSSVYAVLLPIFFVQMLALAFIPSMLSPGARAKEIGRALYCYTMMAVGVVIMSISGVPAAYGLLTDAALGQNIYLSLLLMFAIGGLTFLVYEHTSHALDAASKAVPHALFFYTMKFAGAMMVILATLYLAMTMIFAEIGTVLSDFWITPLIFILYGILLSACTTWPTGTGVKKAVIGTKAPAHPSKIGVAKKK